MEQQLNQYQDNIAKVHGQANLLPVNEQEDIRHQITEAKVSQVYIFLAQCCILIMCI